MFLLEDFDEGFGKWLQGGGIYGEESRAGGFEGGGEGAVEVGYYGSGLRKGKGQLLLL